jgi:hypothetical protein
MAADALIYIAVFLGMAAQDFVWAYYTLALTAHQSIRAGFYASGIILIGGFVTVSYVNDHYLLIAAALGAFVGTASASKLLKRAA